MVFCSETRHWGIFGPRFSLALELGPFSCGTPNQGLVGLGQAAHIVKGVMQSGALGF